MPTESHDELGDAAEQDETQRRSEYLERHRHLEDLVTDSSKSFDTTLITLASGALVLSIGFVNDIVPEPKYIQLLIASWCCFGITLVAMLVSFYLSRRVSEVQLEVSAKDYQRESSQVEDSKVHGLGKTIEYINIGSGLIFVIGVVCLLIFASVNILE